MSGESPLLGHMHAPGEQARFSGVYRAVHETHRPDHEVIVLADECFPSCRACAGKVRFELVRRIDHATHDWDLAGPAFPPAAKAGQ